MRFFRGVIMGAGIISMLMLSACKDESKTKPEASDTTTTSERPLFTLLSSQQTNIDFKNTLVEGPNTNILMYEYFYNGGGVAVGDLNNDGLDDIYFSSNMGTNRLYLNKGEMKFSEAAAQAGVEGRKIKKRPYGDALY